MCGMHACAHGQRRARARRASACAGGGEVPTWARAGRSSPRRGQSPRRQSRQQRRCGHRQPPNQSMCACSDPASPGSMSGRPAGKTGSGPARTRPVEHRRCRQPLSTRRVEPEHGIERRPHAGVDRFRLAMLICRCRAARFGLVVRDKSGVLPAHHIDAPRQRLGATARDAQRQGGLLPPPAPVRTVALDHVGHERVSKPDDEPARRKHAGAP